MAVVLNENGDTTITDVTPERSFTQALITDGQGDTLVVSKKGLVMGKKEYQFAGDNHHLLNEYHRQLDSLGEWQFNFLPYGKQEYGFDYLGSGNHGIFSGSDYYPQVGSYDFRYKSVECGKNDKVIVEFDTYREKDSVVFKDKYGVTYPIKDRILTFTGVNQADTNFIYAYRGDQKIGKLFLNTYQQKTYKVVFVRVNGAAKKLNAKEITKYLNKVYNQCSVSFEDSIDNITIDDLTSFSHGGSGILTVYNDDQKRVLQAYDKEMKDGVFYLFFIDNVTDKKDGSGTLVSGYMPRGYNCGFIYDGGSPRTIAHELGHGIAGLEHPFANSNASGKTANLMDYATGEQLWHFQWDQIQDPGRVWMKWNKDEGEGESYFLKSTFLYALSNDNRPDTLYNNYSYNSFVNSHLKISFHYLQSKHIDIANLLASQLQKDGNLLLDKNFSIDYDPTKISYSVYQDSKMICNVENNQVLEIDALKIGSYSIIIDFRKAIWLSGNFLDTNDDVFDKYYTTDNCSLILNLYLNVYDNCVVEFRPKDVNSYYKNFGFDDAKINENIAIEGHYETIKISGHNYYVPWLCVYDSNPMDILINLNIKPAKNSYFELKTNNALVNGLDEVIIKGNDIYEPLAISKIQKGIGSIEIFYCLNKRTKQLIGKLEVERRDKKKAGVIQFVIVKMDNDKEFLSINPDNVIKDINTIYAQAGIYFQHTKMIDTLFVNNKEWDTKSLAVLVDLYHQRMTGSLNNDLLYIFYSTRNSEVTQNGVSFMPNLEYGRNICVHNLQASTICHEIGHSMGLFHTFEYPKKDNTRNISDKCCMICSSPINKYSTKNIMDYYQINDERLYFFKYQINHFYNIYLQ